MAKSINTFDVESMLNGQLKPAYNVRIAVGNYFVIHGYVSNDRTDYNALIPVLEKQKKAFTEDCLKEVTADSGYCSGCEYKAKCLYQYNEAKNLNWDKVVKINEGGKNSRKKPIEISGARKAFSTERSDPSRRKGTWQILRRTKTSVGFIVVLKKKCIGSLCRTQSVGISINTGGLYMKKSRNTKEKRPKDGLDKSV